MFFLPYPLMDESLVEEEDTLASNTDLTAITAHGLCLYRLQIPKEFVRFGKIREEILSHGSVVCNAGVVSSKFHQFVQCGQTALVSEQREATLLILFLRLNQPNSS